MGAGNDTMTGIGEKEMDVWHILCFMLAVFVLGPAPDLPNGRQTEREPGMNQWSGCDRVEMMRKKIAYALVASLLLAPMVPSTGWSWYGGPPPHHHGGHGDEALLWGLGGLALGAVLATAAIDDPPPRRVVYAEPEPVAYAYSPPVPATCRWERNVVDRYGRLVFDRYGEPIREYTSGPCDYPPPW